MLFMVNKNKNSINIINNIKLLCAILNCYMINNLTAKSGEIMNKII
jgi:hypothetical protein